MRIIIVLGAVLIVVAVSLAVWIAARDRESADTWPLAEALEISCTVPVRSEPPLTQPTSTARRYGDEVVSSISLSQNRNKIVVSCSITNGTGQAIQQLVLQVNLRDAEGSVVAWLQGPLFLKTNDETGRSLTAMGVGVETPATALSTTNGPLQAGATMTFSLPLTACGKSKAIVSAEVEVMDIEFVPWIAHF